MDGAGILIFLAALLLFALVILFKTVRIVPQQTSLIIERLGRYARTLEGGIHILIPFVDKVRANVDLREQVVSFPRSPSSPRTTWSSTSTRSSTTRSSTPSRPCTRSPTSSRASSS